MNISIPAERNKNGYHVFITPCLVEESTLEPDDRSEVTFKYPLESQKKTMSADEPIGNGNTEVIVDTADQTEAVGQPAKSGKPSTDHMIESQVDIDSPGTDRPIEEKVIEHVFTNTAVDGKDETNNPSPPSQSSVTTAETPKTEAHACETVVPEENFFPGNGSPSPRKDANELKAEGIVLSSEAHTSDNTVENTSPEIKSSLTKAKQPAKQVLNKKEVANNNFISMKLSIGVVNTYSKDVIHNWLTHCGITASKKSKVHKLRTKLLKYIQNVQEGNERPKISFVASFLEKITYSELLAEAKRLQIPIKKHARETENRRKVNEFFSTEASSKGTPPQLLTTDEELSQSEVDSEDSGEDESWTQNRVKKVQKRSTQPKKGKNKQDKSKDVKDTTSVIAKNVSAEDFKKHPTEDETEPVEKKAERKPKEPSSNPPMTEIWVKTLETTLLDLQNKVFNQGMLIDALNKKTLPDICIPSDEHAKKIKSTESKMKLLCDTLNIQQNSIDNLSEDVAAGVKEKKRAQDKISQIQNSIKQQNGSNEETFKQLNSRIDSLVQRNTQYEQLLIQVKEEVNQVTSSISNIVDGMKTVMSEIEALKSERSKPDTVVGPSWQLYQESMLTEMKNMRLESRTQLLDIKDMLAEYKSITTPKPVVMPEIFLHTSSIAKNEKNKGSQPKETKIISRDNEKKASKGQAAPYKPQHTLDHGKNDEKVNNKPPHNQQTEKPAPSTGADNDSASNEEKMEHDPSQPESEKPRTSYRRKFFQLEKNKKLQPARTGDKQRNAEAAVRGSQEERGNISIDNTFYTKKEAKKQMFETRKCVVIHDPYFDKFDKNKFSKWFDITSFRYETLKAAKADKSLQSKINKIHPEVIFLHVGQADLLNRTAGNKVVADLKHMIDTLSAIAAAKICTSLIIPLEAVPQVKSTISQVNREIANYVSDLREKEGEIIKSCQIFCLQETKKEVQFSEFRCFNQIRKSSRSGGVCIGIHRSLEKYIKQLKTGDEDIAAINLSRKYSGMDKDLLIINVYDSPENSSYKKRINEDGTKPSTLDNLLDFLGSQRDCEVLLAGDLNARTGNLNFVCQNEDWEDHTESNTCSESRSSKDIIVNERGKRLLDLISCSNLSFLNGCMIGDVIGDFTCLRYNGSSVVDYIATSPHLRKQIRKFTVMPFTNLSDHRPIKCSINMENEPVLRAETIAKQYRDTLPRQKWNTTTSPTVFRLEATLNPAVSAVIQEATNLECNSVDDVLQLNAKITKTFTTICGNIETSNNSGSVDHERKSKRKYLRPKHRWFDKECMIAKRELNRLAKLYGKNPRNVHLRETYYNKRKAYRKLIKRKKGDHLRAINEEIMKNNEISWDKIKELKATKPEKSTLDIFDMINFYRFFKELYKEHPLPKEAEDKIQHLKVKNRQIRHQMHFSVVTGVTISLSMNGKENVYKTESSSSTALSRKTSS
ncbi:hypothetical protein ACHWQZ_G013064 [Mnemiopsis leidyi]